MFWERFEKLVKVLFFDLEWLRIFFWKIIESVRFQQQNQTNQ